MSKRIKISLVVLLVLAFGVIFIGIFWPHAASAPLPAAHSNLTTITQGDQNTTVHVPQGEHFLVAMGDKMTWTIVFAPAGVMTHIASPSQTGVQGEYVAAQMGTTTMTAIGAPICKPGELCPQFRTIVKVKLAVDPAVTTK